MSTIHDLLQDAPIGNSNFQSDNFVTKKAGGPTLWGQYKQALRELHVRYGNFLEYSFDLKEELLKIKKQELKLEKLKQKSQQDPDPILLIDIDILENRINKRKTMVIESKNEFIKGQKEFMRFYAHATILRTKIEAKYGKVTDALKDQLEEDFWTQDAYDTIAKLYIADRNITPEKIAQQIIGKLTHFPTKTQQKVLESIEKREQLAIDFINRPKEYITEEEIEQTKKELPTTQKLLASIINNRSTTTFLIEELKNGEN